MALVVADSDALIDFFAGREPMAGAVLAARAAQTLATTAVSRFEVLAGARNDAERGHYLKLLDAVRILPLDAAASDRAAQVYRTLESGGQRVPSGDCLIAGIVLQHGGTLLTRNRRHFERVKDLHLA